MAAVIETSPIEHRPSGPTSRRTRRCGTWRRRRFGRAGPVCHPGLLPRRPGPCPGRVSSSLSSSRARLVYDRIRVFRREDLAADVFHHCPEPIRGSTTADSWRTWKPTAPCRTCLSAPVRASGEDQGVCDQPVDPQTRRGDLRLDEDGGRPGADPIRGAMEDPTGDARDGRGIQPAAAGASDADGDGAAGGMNAVAPGSRRMFRSRGRQDGTSYEAAQP